jgi:hypothetical protein
MINKDNNELFIYKQKNNILNFYILFFKLKKFHKNFFNIFL